MAIWQGASAGNRGYVAISALAMACALWFAAIHAGGPVPVLGTASLPAATLFAAMAGLPLLVALQNRGIIPAGPVRVRGKALARLVALAVVLAVPPVLIDLFAPFPRDMNVAFPNALLFYPAIGLVAEAVFHLVPLALLAGLAPRHRPAPFWIFVPAVIAEPVFQGIWSSGDSVKTALVLTNVTLISAAQIWLFRRHGFAAMYALRLIFYVIWHVAWGTMRLAILF